MLCGLMGLYGTEDFASTCTLLLPVTMASERIQWNGEVSGKYRG